MKRVQGFGALGFRSCKEYNGFHCHKAVRQGFLEMQRVQRIGARGSRKCKEYKDLAPLALGSAKGTRDFIDRGLSEGRQRAVTGLSEGCQRAVTGLSEGCQRVVKGLSDGCQRAGCQVE